MILEFVPFVATTSTEAYEAGIHVHHPHLIKIDGVPLRGFLGCDEDEEVDCLGVFAASDVALGDVDGCTIAADVVESHRVQNMLVIDKAENFRIIRTKAENEAEQQKFWTQFTAGTWTVDSLF